MHLKLLLFQCIPGALRGDGCNRDPAQARPRPGLLDALRTRQLPRGTGPGLAAGPPRPLSPSAGLRRARICVPGAAEAPAEALVRGQAGLSGENAATRASNFSCDVAGYFPDSRRVSRGHLTFEDVAEYQARAEIRGKEGRERGRAQAVTPEHVSLPEQLVD